VSFSRRQFIIGSSSVAAGLILPSFATRVLSHVEKTGEPLLEGTKSTDHLFHALFRGEGYVLIDTSAGNTLLTPPPTTWRELFEFDGGIPSEVELEANWDLSLDELDDEADEFAVESQWEASRSPTAQALVRLKPLEEHIGPCADNYHEDNEEFGFVEFCEFTNPCSSDRFVEVTSLAALSCLQQRLKDLGARIKIEVADDDDYFG
jgi:hypothetical protein